MISNYNEIRLSGQIVKIYPTKYTIQNIPVVSFVVEHKSLQIECEQSRNVKCRIYCISLNNSNLVKMSLLDKFVNISGFLSQNAKSQLVLHIKTIEFLDEGN